MYKFLCLCIWLCFAFTQINAQTYSPVAITGFTHDIFAETGTNAQATTTTDIDGTNHVMYTEAFASTNGLTAGVLNSGTIVNGSHTFQLAPYSSNNSIYLSLNGNAANSSPGNTLTLQTPAKYSAISFLGFSTEGSSTVSFTLNFTDGTTANYGNITYSDWFLSGNVYSGFGRIARLAAPPYSADGQPANPRWAAYDFFVGCANANKLLQSVTINFVTQGGTSGRALILAISGEVYTPLSVSGVITPATCSANNGSIALTTTGGTAPLSYVWNTVPPQLNSTATSLNAGTYTASVSDATGCIVTYTGIVTQSTSITATAIANPTSICSGDSATLTASAINGTTLTYTWSPGGQTGPVIKVGPTDTTTYTVSASEPGGCTTTATVTVAVRKKPVAAFTTSPQRFCVSSTDTVRFTGTAGSTANYNWNFDNANIVSGAGTGPYNIKFSTAGNHIIKLTVTENGCSSAEVTQTVIADASSQPAFTVAPASICSGDTVLINFTGTAVAGSVPNWNWGGGTVIFGSGTGPFAVKYTTGGTTQLIINNNTCADTAATKTVAVTPSPTAAFTFGKLNCAPVIIPFTNNSQNGTTYFWDFGDGTTSTDQTPPPHSYTASGNYAVKLTVTNGNCSATSPSQTIRLVDPPVANFTSTPDITATPLQLSLAQFNFINTSTGATSYKWLFGDGDSSTQANPVHRYKTPGAYNVSLFVSYDVLACIDSISKSPYLVIADSALRIPNAFSPNNDGINDRWQIPGLLGYPDCWVEVFDRYGQIVFTSRGYNNPWDGKRNGSELPTGTYYYVIRTSIKNYTGWVFLVR